MKTLLDREDLVFNPPQLGCVFYLPGLPGGGSKIYDRSPYGHVCAIMGAHWVWLPSGLWVLSFDGQDDNVNCGNATSLKLSKLTLLAWVKTSYTDAVYKGAVAKPFAYAFGVKNSKMSCYDWGGAGWRDNGVANIADDRWHLLGATFDGTTGQFYVDAIIDGDSFSYSVVNQTVALYVGSGSVSSEYLAALIALPRVYNRVLSALEIGDHFDREKHLFGVWSR